MGGYSDILSSSSSSIGGGLWCKKHPKHKQSPGVCSCCLREKLSFHLNSSSFFSSIHSSTSSQTSSPIFTHEDEATKTTTTTTTQVGIDETSSSNNSSGGVDGFKRSHSSGGINEERKNKKGGFLLKFLKPTSKKCSRMVCMMQHSKTMNEARTKRFY